MKIPDRILQPGDLPEVHRSPPAKQGETKLSSSGFGGVITQSRAARREPAEGDLPERFCIEKRLGRLTPCPSTAQFPTEPRFELAGRFPMIPPHTVRGSARNLAFCAPLSCTPNDTPRLTPWRLPPLML